MARDVIITPLDGDIQFKNTSGTDAGKIEQSGDDLVLSNAVGDILLGDGSSDVYIGDGVNNVDIVFEQDGSIRGESGANVILTLGSADTSLIIQSPSIQLSGSTKFGDSSDDVHQFTGSLQQSGSDSYFLGNVGVGTISPSSLLDLNIPLAYSDGVTFNTNDEVYSIWSNSNLNGLAINYGAVGNTLTYGIFLRYDGNVGIGTSSPGARLHVYNGSAGAVTANSTYDDFVVENNGNAGMSFLTPDGNTAGISWGTPSDSLSALINFNNSNGLMTIGSYAPGGELQLLSGNAGSSVRIDSSGNVGIGTTSPSYKLDVSGSGNFTNGLTVTGSTDFGDSSDDIHEFTGSIQLSGSFTVNNQYTLPQTSASAASSSLMDDGSGNLFFGPVVTAGTYIPSASHLVNLDSVDATHELMYSYIAPILTIGGRIGTNATAGTGVHSFRLSLPSFVVNNFSDDEQAAGIAKDQEGDRGFTIEALSGSNQIFVYNNSTTNTGNAIYRFTCVVHVQ